MMSLCLVICFMMILTGYGKTPFSTFSEYLKKIRVSMRSVNCFLFAMEDVLLSVCWYPGISKRLTQDAFLIDNAALNVFTLSLRARRAWQSYSKCHFEPFAFCHSEGAERPKNLAQDKVWEQQRISLRSFGHCPQDDYFRIRLLRHRPKAASSQWQENALLLDLSLRA